MRHTPYLMITLSVEKREKSGARAPALRRAGKLPAVVYGARQPATAIALDARAFEKALAEAGESAIVMLEGLGAGIPTLIHEVDLDPVKHAPRHVDFYAVTKGQKVEVAVPLEFTGEAPAVKEGANLVKVLHELEVEADPMNLPHAIIVDLSALAAIGDRIRAADLALPAGVALAADPDEVVALVQEVVEEKVEEAPAADLSAIEVEAKGKEVAEGKDGEAAEGAAAKE